MTSNEHLQQLLEVRGALLREVARLDAAIARQNAQSREMGAYRRLDRHDPLSWEEALHRAKIREPHEAAAMQA